VTFRLHGGLPATRRSEWEAFAVRGWSDTESFGSREYWDTFMRDGAQVIKARRYTDQNPVKAGLVSDAKAWQWSSARFRDSYGRLEWSPKR
jgi:hypothetical protein